MLIVRGIFKNARSVYTFVNFQLFYATSSWQTHLKLHIQMLEAILMNNSEAYSLQIKTLIGIKAKQPSVKPTN